MNTYFYKDDHHIYILLELGHGLNKLLPLSKQTTQSTLEPLAFLLQYFNFYLIRNYEFAFYWIIYVHKKFIELSCALATSFDFDSSAILYGWQFDSSNCQWNDSRANAEKVGVREFFFYCSARVNVSTSSVR